MRRRIASAIVGVTAFVLLVLGIPLAVVTERSVLRSEVVELQATVAETLTELALPLDGEQLRTLENEPDAPPPFSVYDSRGDLVFGNGPANPDEAVIVALTGTTASTTDGEIVVATPITDDDEVVVGVLRVAEPLTRADDRTRRAWLIMGAAGLAAVGGAWVIADRLGRRLAEPVVALAEAARRLGDGGGITPAEPTGIAEIDSLNVALADGSARIHESLARERRFSSDVSHQLRTPLAGLRLKIEAAADGVGDRRLTAGALDDLDRIERTVEHLLAFARDAVPVAEVSSLARSAREATTRWSDRAQLAGRSLAATVETEIDVQASASAIGQVLDILIDNAIEHGHGAIDVVVREVAGGASVDVIDEGSIDEQVDGQQLFDRHVGTNHGIGLALARSIVEAEGGRLVLSRHSPTTFALIVLAADRI